jgi:uncharacterized membrane protein YphA (DoxX/SURF4 family)
MTTDTMERYGRKTRSSRPTTTYALWTAQALLALIFLFTGGMKLALPVAELIRQMPIPLPGVFLRFLGACELLGAVGLILPGLLRVKMFLTSRAAGGLAIIMIGATVYTLAGGGGAAALMPGAMGVLLTWIAVEGSNRLVTA